MPFSLISLVAGCGLAFSFVQEKDRKEEMEVLGHTTAVLTA
jgi:hypothetical protein